MAFFSSASPPAWSAWQCVTRMWRTSADLRPSSPTTSRMAFVSSGVPAVYQDQTVVPKVDHERVNGLEWYSVE